MREVKNTIISKTDAAVALEDAFQGFKDHFKGIRISTELTALEFLRKAHPDFHVTCASSGRFDLFGYARAGHAEVEFDCDEDHFDATRIFRVKLKGEDEGDERMGYNGFFSYFDTPVSQASASLGELQNHTRFGRWRYYWESNEYVLYEIEYAEHNRPPVRVCFILSPRTETSTKEGKDSLIDKLLLAVGTWTAQLHNEIYVFDDGFWIKSRELWNSVQGASWDDVILDPIMKDNLVKDVLGFFDSQALYKQLAVPWKRGVIFHGVPGNGKTISIKALINTLDKRSQNISSLYVKSFDGYSGEKVSIRDIFDHARKMSPCLLIFEDLDSLVTDETRSYFLNEVDGLESNDGILMIGSTNHLDKLDPAISKRPSRFDRKYHFNIPGEAERTAYAHFWRQKLAGSVLVDFPYEVCELIAKLTEGFSFAYMKELFVATLLNIARGVTGDGLEQEKATEATPSEDGHVIVEYDDAKSEVKDDGGEKEQESEPQTKETRNLIIPKTKKIIPEVEIPESLQDNVLLRVLKSQVQILLDEMDNTEEGSWPTERNKSGGSGAYRAPHRMRRGRRGCC